MFSKQHFSFILLVQGSHVTLYARNEDDVAPDEIMRQVKKSTSNFTFVAPKEDQSAQAQAVVCFLHCWLVLVLVTFWKITFLVMQSTLRLSAVTS